MPKLDFISYLKTLKPEDWNKKVNTHWTIKDVVAHMVGWEKIDPQIIRDTWRTKKRPWFYETDDFDNFNRKNVQFYKKYTDKMLIAEWEKYNKLSQAEIDRIGEKNLRAIPELFGWLFSEAEDNSHYNHHYQQIRNIMIKGQNENF